MLALSFNHISLSFPDSWRTEPNSTRELEEGIQTYNEHPQIGNIWRCLWGNENEYRSILSGKICIVPGFSLIFLGLLLGKGIRAMTIDKDQAPKVWSLSLSLSVRSRASHVWCLQDLLQWDPPVLDKVSHEKLDLVFQPFKEELELQIPVEGEACRSICQNLLPYQLPKLYGCIWLLIWSLWLLFYRWEGKFENSAYQKA